MVRGGAGVLLAVVFAGACAGGSPPQPQGPTVSSISAQPGDVPKGLVKCDVSGDINTVAAKEATPDPITSKSFQQSWQDAQANGATSGYFAIYANSPSNCSTVLSNATELGATSLPLILTFVVQYKDEKAATEAYTSGTLFNFSPKVLKQGGAPVIEGTATGLTSNSVVLSASIANQTFYVAEWQNKTFVVILAALNVDQNAGKKVAIAENARIK